MILIPDDPIIRSMEATGYPPKVRYKFWAFSDDEEKILGQEEEENEDEG